MLLYPQSRADSLAYGWGEAYLQWMCWRVSSQLLLYSPEGHTPPVLAVHIV